MGLKKSFLKVIAVLLMSIFYVIILRILEHVLEQVRDHGDMYPEEYCVA